MPASPDVSAVGRIAAWPLLAIVWVYRRSFSLLVGAHCRFQPTCSVYAEEALRRYGGFRGGWLVLRRICRCHPWGGAGYDPVPRPNTETGNDESH